MQGGRAGVQILLLSEVILFEYNNSTILLPTVDFQVVLYLILLSRSPLNPFIMLIFVWFWGAEGLEKNFCP